jgi:radical SAM protein with 4Fe4S-binding SPASM domain
LLNKLEFAAQRTRLRSKPVVVDVVLTKACNFACTFCKDYETLGSKRIALSNFEVAARQLMPTASRLSICSGGEPYLHTGLEDILRIARRYNPTLYTWVLSNGSILREDRVRRIISEGLITEHGFSVDGIKPETVEAIRVNAKFPDVVKNIEMFIRIRDEEKKKHPSVTIRYALMRSNIEELPDAVRFWADRGANAIDAGYLSLANGMDPQLSLFYHQELTEKMFERARKAAEAYPRFALNLPETISEQTRYRRSPKKCGAPWSFVMIDTNGQVLPCYRAFEALRFGKLYDADGQDFDSIWNSDEYAALRGTVNGASEDKYYPYCNLCEMRYGWSEERVHLGDETWIDALGGRWLAKEINHKRPVKGEAARRVAKEARDTEPVS